MTHAHRENRDPERPLSIEPRPTTSLRANPRNARTHSRKQIKAIAESIRQFGFTNPILIDDQAVVLAGHGRLEAAKLLKLEQAGVDRAHQPER